MFFRPASTDAPDALVDPASLQEESSAVLSLEVVRAQAKLESPLRNLRTGGGGQVVTMFAEVTLYARTTTLQTTNTVSARLQIDFRDLGGTGCPSTPPL